MPKSPSAPPPSQSRHKDQAVLRVLSRLSTIPRADKSPALAPRALRSPPSPGRGELPAVPSDRHKAELRAAAAAWAADARGSKGELPAATSLHRRQGRSRFVSAGAEELWLRETVAKNTPRSRGGHLGETQALCMAGAAVAVPHVWHRGLLPATAGRAFSAPKGQNWGGPDPQTEPCAPV